MRLDLLTNIKKCEKSVMGLKHLQYIMYQRQCGLQILGRTTDELYFIRSRSNVILALGMRIKYK
jgi:hypothetical protein